MNKCIVCGEDSGFVMICDRCREQLSEKVYSNVIERKGGPFSLYCTSCKRWIPNTANYEMKKEGVIAHSHCCVNGICITPEDGGIQDEAVKE